MDKKGGIPPGRKKLYAYGFFVLAALAILLPIHFNLVYEPVTDRNARLEEAIKRRADIRPSQFVFGVCGESRESRSVFENILHNLEWDDTAFCVHLGDGTHGQDLTSYAFFLRQLELLEKPMLMVPGGSETGSEKGEANFAEIFGPGYYSFVAGECCFIMLDDNSGEGIDGEQEVWLQAELEKSMECKARFVFFHHPLFDPPGSQPGAAMKDSEAARRLQDLFDRYDVTMIFASHSQGFFQGVWGSTTYIVTGGGGFPIEGVDANNRFYNYVRVIVSPESVDYEVVRVDPPASPGQDAFLYKYGLHTYGFFAIWFWYDLFLLAVVAGLAVTLICAVRRSRRKHGAPVEVESGPANGTAGTGPETVREE